MPDYVFRFDHESSSNITLAAVDTRILLFPRSRDRIFLVEKIERDESFPSFIKNLPFNRDYLAGYEERTEFNSDLNDTSDITGDYAFKDLEFNLYTELSRCYYAEEESYSTKKVSLLFEKSLIQRTLLDVLLRSDSLRDMIDEDDYFDDVDLSDFLVIRYSGNHGDLKLGFQGQVLDEITLPLSDVSLKVNGIGMLEFEILCKEPDENITDITVEALITDSNGKELGDSLTSLSLHLVKNTDFPELEDIENNDDAIWFYPEGRERPALNGMKRLQYICNQIVPRHKGITTYNYLDESGIYNEATKNALALYLNCFTNLVESESFPYRNEMTTIGISEELTTYFSAEYGYDVSEIKGRIVNRRLLVGEDTSHALEKTDGLKDLYDNVVVPFQNGFVARAMEYVNNTKPWFANPGQSYYYEMGEVTLQTEKILFKETEDVPITIGGNNVTIPQGTSVLPLNESVNKRFTARGYPEPGKYLISYPIDGNNIRGRVQLTKEDLETRQDDRTNNKGNYTQNGNSDFGNFGIPYTLAGKLPLDEFNNMPDAEGDIYNWSRYELQNPRKPRTGDNDSAYGDVYYRNKFDELDSYKIAGIDCSGLVKRCLKETCFEGTAISIFPFCKIHLLDNYSASNTTVLARTIATDTEKLVRKGDILWRTSGRSSHVTIVYGDGPPDKDLRIGNSINNDSFQIVHAYGGGTEDTRKKHNAFLGRTIKSPIGKKIWRSFLDVNLVRVYLWS